MLTAKLAIRLAKCSAVLALAVSLAACGGSPTGGAPKGGYLKDAPSDIAAVYKSRCLNCHGNDLQGRVGANTNLQQVGSRMSFEEIAAQIEQGEGLMPGFADTLSQKEIDGLAEWLASKQ
ncbi:cytochrome c [Paenibacillus sp. 1011MAR3C5]|uniref:c-type cytochrome n=1 Tax=Paenibacillus sp. 1011MAR3C5 TaxID=1675787 RepID=UPI002175C5E5|nr:cytochrome c [Paenibacillus sp. 1011MAR3C5]